MTTTRLPECQTFSAARPTARPARSTAFRRGHSEITMSDYFCGAGGSSSGAVKVPGVRVAMAVNHWPLAIETHNTNHPNTDHDQADISAADPARYPRTTIGWFSPECTYWSQARGEKLPDDQLEFDLFGDGGRLPDEAAERSRMTMWDVPRFSAYHLYEAVIVENVPRVVKGAHWQWWLAEMHKLGYEHEVLWVNSMHAQALGPGAPQSRDRVYITFWRTGNPRPDFDRWLRPDAICPDHGLIKSMQVFKAGGSPMKTYGAQYSLRCPSSECRNREVLPPVAGADTIIDWSLRGVPIGERKGRGMRELAEKTLKRTFAGARRHWMPLVVEAAGNTYDATSPRHPQFGDPDAYHRAWPADEPLRTLQATASKALVVNQVSGADASRSTAVEKPLPSIVAAGNHASLLVPVEGRDGKIARRADRPLRTQSTRNETGLLVPLRNHGTAKPIVEPIDTVAASGNHHALVVRNNGEGESGWQSTPVGGPLQTLTTAGHQSLVEPGRSFEEYELTDEAIWQMVMEAEFRMLEPHEIKQGMAFAADYVLLGNKREQVRMAGNAVTPNVARDIVAAVVESLGVEVRLAA